RTVRSGTRCRRPARPRGKQRASSVVRVRRRAERALPSERHEPEGDLRPLELQATCSCRGDLATGRDRDADLAVDQLERNVLISEGMPDRGRLANKLSVVERGGEPND